MNWEDARYFLAVARHGSLSEAASAVDSSAPTVARRIDRLEAALRQVLFVRRHDGYRLTALGARLMHEVERIAAGFDALPRVLGAEAEELRGIVRIATPELLAHELIVPALPRFRQTFPCIALELLTDVRPLPLHGHPADIVIRAVRPREGDYKVRRIGRVAAALFAAPAYLAAHGTPENVSELPRHALIGWDHALQFLAMPMWLARWAGEQEPWLRTTSFTCQLAACAAGAGLAVLPCVVAGNRGLVRVLPDLPPLELDLWMLLSLHTGANARVRRVADFLGDIFAASDLLT